MAAVPAVVGSRKCRHVRQPERHQQVVRLRKARVAGPKKAETTGRRAGGTRGGRCAVELAPLGREGRRVGGGDSGAIEASTARTGASAAPVR